ncbi:acyltransferase family protein [Burkholderia ubonensis]|uniref:Acyltransferase 3 domain-containing protein n=1 Tax=Burkholderia ubonensis TaxID=101571 RepID=A0ABD6QAU4_9BURK|nr:acyltransferase [Burkholderia ubonensis]OJA50990.1 hypothetical protein BGV66_00800 [Burkholderia ubonensis]
MKALPDNPALARIVKRAPRNLELDRLRAIAVLLTCYVHWRQVFYPWTFTMHFAGPATPLDLLSNAWAGVDLFFVISGYIISHTIVREFDALRDDPGALAAHVKAFYVRRAFRILPVAWCVILIVIACGAFLNAGGYFADSVYNLQAALSIFTYTFNFWLPDHKIAPGVPLAPYWSLSVEEQFYLVFPVFLMLTRSTRQRALWLALSLIAISVAIRPYLLSDPVKVFFYTQTRCDGMLYGCLLYLATTRPWFAAIRVSARGHGYLGGVVVLVLALVLGSITAIGFDNVVAVPVVCMLSVALVFLAACEGGIVSFPQPLQWIFDCIGRRSYSLYLVHLPMFFVVTELMFRYTRAHGIAITAQLWPQYTLLMALLVAGATELLYRGVERPMIAKGRRVAAGVIGATQTALPKMD